MLSDSDNRDKSFRAVPSSLESFYNPSRDGHLGVRLNPFAISFVQDYISSHAKDLMSLQETGRSYFLLMEDILQKFELPGELKYLAVIESKLKSSAVSWAGAVGPWQFMPQTARLMGLRVNRKIDERRDFEKSTYAASKYLKQLYEEFGDWLLVIAAYNGGPGNVYSAIRKSGSENFWTLQRYLPNETRNHVKKYIATHYILEGQGGVTTLTKEETQVQLSALSHYQSLRNLSDEELLELKTLSLTGKYLSHVIARTLLMDWNEFNRYNPNFDKVMASSGNTYELKLPASKMDAFITKKYQILNESVQLMLNGWAIRDGVTGD
ncbi:MAG: lytic transglycosylase domain-containing protein [Chitinophagaceae bacterium]